MDEAKGSNENWLFHGTPGENCQHINHTGFNRSFHGKNGEENVIITFILFINCCEATRPGLYAFMYVCLSPNLPRFRCPEIEALKFYSTRVNRFRSLGRQSSSSSSSSYLYLPSEFFRVAYAANISEHLPTQP